MDGIEIASHVSREQPFIWTVLAVCRIPLGTGFNPDWVEMGVYVQADERTVLNVKKTRGARWISDEALRLPVCIADNRKTLAWLSRFTTTQDRRSPTNERTSLYSVRRRA